MYAGGQTCRARSAAAAARQRQTGRPETRDCLGRFGGPQPRRVGARAAYRRRATLSYTT